MSGVKVFGWTGMREGVQTREIVMTTSWQRAADAAGPSVTVGYLRKYGSKTENSEEWEIARRFPGVVCYRPLDANPRKTREGWFLNNGDPLTITFDAQRRDLLRRAMSPVKELQELIERESGWAELYNVENHLLAAASAMGIPQSEITDA